ncbi:FtsW/RodA/SpoVE family cell cycle protein, partial [Cutibacterium acnes]
MNVIVYWLGDRIARFARTLDLPLLGALLALMAIGLAVLYSAGDRSTHLVIAQGARFGVGLGAMWLLSRLPPAQLRYWTPWAFGLSLIPLLLVLAIGQGKHGAHWINLGVFYFQPSELLKLTLPMMVAWYL